MADIISTVNPPLQIPISTLKEGKYAICQHKTGGLPVGAVGFVLRKTDDEVVLMFEPNQYPCLKDLKGENKDYVKEHWDVKTSHYRYFVGKPSDFAPFTYGKWRDKGKRKAAQNSTQNTEVKDENSSVNESGTTKTKTKKNSSFSIHTGDYFVLTKDHLTIKAGTIGRCLSTEVMYGMARFDKSASLALHNVAALKDINATAALGFDPHDPLYYTFPLTNIRPVKISDVIPDSLKCAKVSVGDTVQLPSGVIGRAVYIQPHKDGAQVMVATELGAEENQTCLTESDSKEAQRLAEKAYSFGLDPSEKIYSAFYEKALLVV